MAQRYIKEFTRHNDKLGFDFDNSRRKYKASLGDQFASSAYPEFLVAASKFYKDNAKNELSAHFSEAATKFTLKDR